MAAHVGHRHLDPVEIGDPDGARIGQSGLFLDRQGVHIAPTHEDRPVAVLKDADNAGDADARLHFEAEGLQLFRDDPCRAGLHEAQFRVRV